MGAVDLAEHIWLKGNITKKQYMWALGFSFILGAFVQWQGMYQELVELRKPRPVVQDEDSRKTIEGLKKELADSDREVQKLRRDSDRAEASLKASTAEALDSRQRIEERQRIINGLQARLDDRQRRQEINITLGHFLDRGEELKRIVLRDIDKPVPIEDIDKWAEEVVYWLAKYVGPGQSALFRNPPAGLPYSHGKPQQHENAWNLLEQHLNALRGFMKDSEFDLPEKRPQKKGGLNS